nr:nucleotidyltransferase family protein [Eubacterium sp.]
MANLGIIAEFNPFHNGHKYLYSEAVKKCKADNVIALMSGNFIQRGAPAMADKYSRAEAAVIGGIDAVFELPVIYATGSARDFAAGAVAILNEMKIIDYIAFGVEDDVPEFFDEVTDILANEPKEYKDALNENLTKGFS